MNLLPLNITDINSKTGHFELRDDNDNHVGVGRAKPSHIAGLITLTLYNKGGTMVIRVPINWLEYLEVDSANAE